MHRTNVPDDVHNACYARLINRNFNTFHSYDPNTSPMIIKCCSSQYEKGSANSSFSDTINTFAIQPTNAQLDIVRSVYHVCNIYIYSPNEIHNVVALIKFLLVLRFQLYMFRTVKIHPQELLCRYCMCRLWYVVRRALPDTSGWTYQHVP